FVNLVRAQIFEVYVDRWIEAQKFTQIARQFVQSNAVNRPHPDRAGHYRTDFAQPVFELQEPANYLLARVVQNLTRGGRFDTSASAFYQTTIILVFQAANLLAYGRLGDEVLRCGIRKTTALDDVAKNLQGLDMHLLIPATHKFS